MPENDERPVQMPTLPPTLHITTEQQFKGVADPMRSRILVLLQHEPLTVKGVATRLGAVPGTISHHMQVLEAAGLVQVVATRIIHGIQAKYYARAARIFIFDPPPEMAGAGSVEMDFLSDARAELAEALGNYGPETPGTSGFPHVRLTPERAQHYQERIEALMLDLVQEPLDPAGEVFGMVVAFFRAPPVLQPGAGEGKDDEG